MPRSNTGQTKWSLCLALRAASEVNWEGLASRQRWAARGKLHPGDRARCLVGGLGLEGPVASELQAEKGRVGRGVQGQV